MVTFPYGVAKCVRWDFLMLYFFFFFTLTWFDYLIAFYMFHHSQIFMHLVCNWPSNYAKCYTSTYNSRSKRHTSICNSRPKCHTNTCSTCTCLSFLVEQLGAFDQVSHSLALFFYNDLIYLIHVAKYCKLHYTCTTNSCYKCCYKCDNSWRTWWC